VPLNCNNFNLRFIDPGHHDDSFVLHFPFEKGTRVDYWDQDFGLIPDLLIADIERYSDTSPEAKQCHEITDVVCGCTWKLNFVPGAVRRVLLSGLPKRGVSKDEWVIKNFGNVFRRKRTAKNIRVYMILM
jgi:hypothetical protein